MQKKQKLIAAGLGAGALGLAVALTGGTSAYFYDGETQQADFQAGSVDLVTSGALTNVNVSPDAVVTYDAASKTLHASNLRPGDTFTYDVTYQNVGTLDADSYLSWKVLNSKENGVNEAEGGGGAAGGELEETMKVLFDIDGFGVNAGGVPTPVNSTFYAGPGTTPLGGGMTPDKSRHAKFTFSVPNGGQGAENDIMTDSFDLKVDFALTQAGAPAPTLS